MCVARPPSPSASRAGGRRRRCVRKLLRARARARAARTSRCVRAATCARSREGESGSQLHVARRWCGKRCGAALFATLRPPRKSCAPLPSSRLLSVCRTSSACSSSSTRSSRRSTSTLRMCASWTLCSTWRRRSSSSVRRRRGAQRSRCRGQQRRLLSRAPLLCLVPFPSLSPRADEMVTNGAIVETNKANILKPILLLEKVTGSK